MGPTYCVVCSLSLAAVLYATPASTQYDALVRQGQDMLRAGDLKGAAAQFSAAASLKASPGLLLRVVSLYSDMSRQTSQNQCARVEVTLKQLFLQCLQCGKTDEKQSKCGVCDFVIPSQEDDLAARTDALAIALEKRSQKLGEAAKMLDKESERRTRRRSSGLQPPPKIFAAVSGRLLLKHAPGSGRSYGWSLGGDVPPLESKRSWVNVK